MKGNKKNRSGRVALWAGFLLLAGFALLLSGTSAEAAAKKKKVGKGKISTSKGKFSVNKKTKTILLKKSGTYTVSGKISGYRIVVKKSKLNVTVTLKNAKLSHTKTASIQNLQASSTLTVKSAKKSNNSLTGPSKFTKKVKKEVIDGVIYSAGNLTLSGSGTMTIKDRSSNGDGVKGKQEIVLKSGTVTASSRFSAIKGETVRFLGGVTSVPSSEIGVKASKFIQILGGSVTVNSSDTAIKSTGSVAINGGTIQANAVDKGIQGKSGILIRNGTIRVKVTKNNNTKFEDFRGITAGVAGTHGKKKIAGSILIFGGSITVQSYGDCIRAANNITISGGVFQLTSTTDDGIQAKGTLTIQGSPKFSIRAKSKKVKGEVKKIASSIRY